MGSAMAANLAKAGFKVQGYDIVAKRRTVDAISKIDAPVVITSLPSAEALHAVADELRHKCVVVETSTLPIDDKVTARIPSAKKASSPARLPAFRHRRAGARQGPRGLRERRAEGVPEAKPYLPGFSRAHYYLGEFGNGSKMKFVANLMVAIHNVSAAEAFVLGMKAGLDRRR